MDLLHSLLWLISSEGILHVVNVWGLVGICAIIFAETGIFPILPGDSLLVVAGIAAATAGGDGKPVISLAALLTLVPLCAVIGDQVGYSLGRVLGWTVLDWKERRLGFVPLYKPAWLKQTKEFYERWGVFTVVVCRWVPIVRTFAPILAGASKMPYKKFIPFNVLGAVSWVWSMVAIGYGLKVGLQAVIERFVPGFDVVKHIDKIAVLVIFFSVLPLIIGYFRHRGANAKKKGQVKRVSPRQVKKKKRA